MIRYVKGDITESNCDIICHQVNCQGAMNSGVAKAIREKWPKVYEYYDDWCNRSIWSRDLLGRMQTVEIDNVKKRYVVNLYAQQHYGYTGARYTDYEAFYNAISNLAIEAPPDKTIAFPYKIGCVRGGASWRIIKTMIEEVFANHDVTLYYLDEKDLDWKEQLIVEEYNRKVPVDNG